MDKPEYLFPIMKLYLMQKVVKILSKVYTPILKRIRKHYM